MTMETRFYSRRLAVLLGAAGLVLAPGLARAEPQSSLIGANPSSVIATLSQEAAQSKRLPSGEPRIATQPTAARVTVASPAVAPKAAVAKQPQTPAPLAARHGATPAPAAATSADAEKERILL